MYSKIIYRFLFCFSFLLLSLLSLKANKAQETQKEGQKLPSLQQKLDSKKEEGKAAMPKESQEKFAKAIQKQKNDGLEYKAFQVGDKVPDFTLKDKNGQETKLSEYTKKGPVVLTFYRGTWCPYDALTLSSWQEAYPQIRQQGAELLAISPEDPAKAKKLSEAKDPQFKRLVDDDNKVAGKFGLAYTVNGELNELYKKEKIYLKELNKGGSEKLPITATYILDKQGVIKYAFIDADYKNRPEPNLIIQELKKIVEQ
ncbi:MAG: peroxiredoxin-like family protein [Candidatus Caenarcaniphilales bacterium]|nr:peroxiredoxin-like family protein [Candidatus Caenarcaniphilales bacterium]